MSAGEQASNSEQAKSWQAIQKQVQEFAKKAQQAKVDKSVKPTG